MHPNSLGSHAEVLSACRIVDSCFDGRCSDAGGLSRTDGQLSKERGVGIGDGRPELAETAHLVSVGVREPVPGERGQDNQMRTGREAGGGERGEGG